MGPSSGCQWQVISLTMAAEPPPLSEMSTKPDGMPVIAAWEYEFHARSPVVAMPERMGHERPAAGMLVQLPAEPLPTRPGPKAVYVDVKITPLHPDEKYIPVLPPAELCPRPPR